MSDTYDAVVVGGGIVGSSVGYHLARAGVDVIVVDRSDEGRATYAGAGSIGPATSSQTADDDWYAFAKKAADYYPELVDRLEANGAEETSYNRQGTLGVAVDADEIEAYEAALERIEARGIESVEEIDPGEAAAMFPPLESPQRAFYDAEGARVDGQAFTDSVFAAAKSHGLETVADDVTDIRIDGGSVVGVTTADAGAIDARRVVVAGGAWSPNFGTQLAVDVPVEPQRGQVAHVEVNDAATSDWPIVKGFRHHYIVPWTGGRIVCGATREDRAGFDPRLTVGGVRTVLDEGLRVAPGLEDATLAELRVGLRPLSADGLPVLGAVPKVDGAFLATGHGPTGLTLGPYSGKLVAEAVRGDAGAIPERFHVGRFEGS